MEQMLDHHGFCKLDIFVFVHRCYNDSGAVGRGHEEVEANPKVNVNRPWGGVGEGSLPLGLLDDVPALNLNAS